MTHTPLGGCQVEPKIEPRGCETLAMLAVWRLPFVIFVTYGLGGWEQKFSITFEKEKGD